MKRFLLLLAVIFSIAAAVSCYATVYMSVEEAIGIFFADSKSIETKEARLEDGETILIYIGRTNDKVDGYAITVTEAGKNGPISFIIVVSADGKIKDIAVLDSMEIKGEGIRKKRFLRQFINKSRDDPINLGRDIQAVTGATISSNAAANAARRALDIWKSLFKDEF